MKGTKYRDARGAIYRPIGVAVVSPTGGNDRKAFMQGKFNPMTKNTHPVEIDSRGNLFIKSIVGIGQEFGILVGPQGTWFVNLIDGHPRGYTEVKAA